MDKDLLINHGIFIKDHLESLLGWLDLMLWQDNFQQVLSTDVILKEKNSYPQVFSAAYLYIYMLENDWLCVFLY